MMILVSPQVIFVDNVMIVNEDTLIADIRITKLTFRRLPYELREAICEYCLVVDYEITPYPSLYELYERPSAKEFRPQGATPGKANGPSVSLLQVNK